VVTATVGTLLLGGTNRLRASASETPRLDAELLLGNALGIDRTGVLAHPDAPVGDGQAVAFETALARRETGEPVAYIRGLKEFYGLIFTVDLRALIPRPETEGLVELAIERVREALVGAPRGADAPPLRIWDVGTGSGAIAVAVAITLRRRGYGGYYRVLASDVSGDALAVAIENAVGHGVADVIDFASGDLLAVDPPAEVPVDLLLANLPYIPSATLPDLPVAASFEPPLALDGGTDGLDLVRRLLAILPTALAPTGSAFLEIGADQAEPVTAAAAEAVPGWKVLIHPDLSGQPRVAEILPPRTAPG
jgi:release factor glutamine methyltransferase